MSGVDRELVRRFVEAAAEALQGDWVVMGGAVLPLVGIEHRTTWDIDVAGPGDARLDQTLVLMGIAERLGLPVEAINQAGAYFLHRIEGWREHVVTVREGARARILRPDATLFLLLKIGRMTESDLADCERMLDVARAGGEAVDAARIEAAIAAESAACAGNAEKVARLARLRAAVAG